MATHIGTCIKFGSLMLIFLLGLSACSSGDDDECNPLVAGTMPYLCFLPGGAEDAGSDTAPIAPYNLSLDLLPEGGIDIEWYSNQSISTFWVYRNKAKLAKVSADWWDTVVRTTDDSIEPKTRYCYTVTALDSTGNVSAHSDEVCITTHDDVTAPAVPVIIDATSLSTQTYEIGISWEEPNDDFHVSGYKVFRDGNLIADVSELYFNDTGLVGITQYCYSVIAYDQSLNESAESEPVCATTSWVITVLDLNAPVPAVELALDALGQVHVAYSSISYQPTIDIKELFYMTNAGGTWATEILDHASGSKPSIALEPGDAVHIGQGTKHTTNLSGEWNSENIDDALSIVSLDLDSTGDVHLLYRPQAPTAQLDKFNYATNFGGVWSSVSLGETGARYYRLALDNFDAVHIVYYIDSTNELTYMNNSSGVWVTEIVEQDANILWNIAIAIDSSGKAHLSYYDRVNRDLKYASNVSNTWVVGTIDSQGDVGSGSAIAVADNGTVHISYTDQTDQNLKYVSNASGIWSPVIIDSVNSVRGFTTSWPGYVYPGITSIAVDTTDKVHIAYTGGEYYAAKVLYVTNR